MKLVKGIHENTGYELEDVLLAAQDDKRKQDDAKKETEDSRSDDDVGES